MKYCHDCDEQLTETDYDVDYVSVYTREGEIHLCNYCFTEGEHKPLGDIADALELLGLVERHSYRV